MVGIVAGAAIAGVAISAYSAVEQKRANKKARVAQEQANAAQQRMASADAARARLQQVREMRMRNATMLSAGVTGGMGVTSSGIAGGIGSVTTQAAGNIGTINQKEGFAGEISFYNQQAADAQTSAANAQQWGQLGMTVAGMAVQRIK